MTPLISILIPCYNAEPWIAETLESALGQTWPNKEIIVVDDGSSDGSFSILERFCSRGIKVISQENQGASTARNRALREARGDYIQFLDADDLLAPNKIEIQLKRLAQGSALRVASGSWGRFYDEPKNTRFLPESVWVDLDPVDWICSSWSGGGMMVTHSWLTPRGIIENAGDWNEARSPVDDGEFFTRVVLNSEAVLFCPEARSYYRSGIPKSWSARRTPEMIRAVYGSIEACTGHLLAVENSNRTRAACASLFQRFIYDTYPQLPDLLTEAEDRVKALGGSNHEQPGGGIVFRLLAESLGWKAARRIQLAKQRMRFS
jgi:glycosyltransferase involved in cell wall biosynthesis